MGLPRTNYLANYAMNLRRNETESEKRLWFGFLKDYPIPFRRQKVIGCYIVDFFSNKTRISIELDGSQHFSEDSLIKDQYRTRYLELLEVKELRFSNYEIWNDFEGVCELIHQEVMTRRNDVVEIPLQLLKSKR